MTLRLRLIYIREVAGNEEKQFYQIAPVKVSGVKIQMPFKESACDLLKVMHDNAASGQKF